jgi:hypothetical protein
MSILPLLMDWLAIYKQHVLLGSPRSQAGWVGVFYTGVWFFLRIRGWGFYIKRALRDFLPAPAGIAAPAIPAPAIP